MITQCGQIFVPRQWTKSFSVIRSLILTLKGYLLNQCHQFLRTSLSNQTENFAQIYFMFKLKKLYGPFLWMGFNCLKAIEPLRGGSLLFPSKFPESQLRRMKGWVNLGVTQWFWIRNPKMVIKRMKNSLGFQKVLWKGESNKNDCD